jgi:hypothetical protein
LNNQALLVLAIFAFVKKGRAISPAFLHEKHEFKQLGGV